MVLLREVDQRLKLSEAVSAVLPDNRQAKRCIHDGLSLLRQRLYALALGYADLNDHDVLRDDIALQSAINRDDTLASSPTLSRFENQATRDTAVQIHRVIVDQFIASFKRTPKRLVLDFDATDDRVHGNQEGSEFHGYYDHYCFLPLYVFCQDQLLVSYLRNSRIDGAKHAWAILSLLVKRFRQVWPKVKITFRGDSGFCRHKLLSWCERHGVDYMVGLAKNDRLNACLEPLMREAEERHEQTGNKIRRFTAFQYGARSWGQTRRIIGKAEIETVN